MQGAEPCEVPDCSILLQYGLPDLCKACGEERRAGHCSAFIQGDPSFLGCLPTRPFRIDNCLVIIKSSTSILRYEIVVWLLASSTQALSNTCRARSLAVSLSCSTEHDHNCEALEVFVFIMEHCREGYMEVVSVHMFTQQCKNLFFWALFVHEMKRIASLIVVQYDKRVP